MKKTSSSLETLHQLHRSGELDAARAGYLTILRKNPREVSAIHALGIIATQQENYSEASHYLQQAIDLQPNDPTLQLHLANVLKIQGLFSQAAIALHNALELQPHYTLAMNNLGTVYYALGKLPEAVEFYRRAILENPVYIDAHYNLGLALTKQEKYIDAVETYETLLNYAPEHFAARFHLGCVLILLDRVSDALTQFLNIEEKHPHHFETESNLATCYLKLGKLSEAKQHYIKALELMPEDTQILYNLGYINMQQGFTDNAIQNYQRAIKLNPNYFAAHNNLGVAFLAKQHIGFALQHFNEALRLQPKNEAVRYTINMLSQHQHLLAAPPDYVKTLFDAYADHYEPHLLEALDYQLPQLLHDAVLKSEQTSWDILDLGCGTGLCGVKFKPFSKTLIGVDLSAKMLDVAAQKNIYDELIAEDITDFLETKKSAYDLILSGDVFVYIGDLDSIFKNVNNALRNNGLFAFNAEIQEQTDYRMNQSGRFSHSKKYLDQLAESHHFKIIHYSTPVTRTQHNEPVYGHLYVLQKTRLSS